MKKLLALIVIISTFLLSSCDLLNRGITMTEFDGYVKITLDNFTGSKKIVLDHDDPNEGTLYFKTEITDGSLSASYDEGWLWEAMPLFTASFCNDVNSSRYIDSSKTKVTITIKATEAVSGEIIFGLLRRPSPFK